MGKEGSVKINYDLVLAWFIHTHPFDKKLAYALPHNSFKLMGYLFYFRLVAPVKATLHRMLDLVRGKKADAEGRRFVKQDLATIKDAVEYLSREYTEDLKFDSI
jgi:hypothetical protein